MKRREFITLVGGATVAWPLAARAQQASMPVIGFLGGAPAIHLTSAFELRLRELGWIVRQNVVIEYRWIAGDPARYPALVEELVALNPNVMVGSNQAAIAMRQATDVIPIVATGLIDPVGFGLVASHARPGGNVTGILAMVDTLPEKQLALAAEVVPGVKMGMLLNTGSQARTFSREGAERAARALAIQLVPVETRLPDDLDAAFQSMARQRLDGVLVPPDVMFFAERRRIAMLAIEARLPTMFGLREHVAAGGLMSYGADLRANFRLAADYVDKILKGTKPADLPVELPTRFELVINLKTAKTIGLTIPETFLVRADEVIE